MITALLLLLLAAWVLDQLAHLRALRRYHDRAAARRHYQRPDGAPRDYP